MRMGTWRSAAALTTSATFHFLPMLPGLRRRASMPCPARPGPACNRNGCRQPPEWDSPVLCAPGRWRHPCPALRSGLFRSRQLPAAESAPGWRPRHGYPWSQYNCTEQGAHPWPMATEPIRICLVVFFIESAYCQSGEEMSRSTSRRNHGKTSRTLRMLPILRLFSASAMK